MRRVAWTHLMPALVLFCMAATAEESGDQPVSPGTTQTTTTTKTTTTKTTVIEEVAEEVEITNPTPKRAAIFIKNRVGDSFADKTGAFEDFVIGEVTDLGLAVTSPEDTVTALRKFLGKAPDASIPGSELDKILEQNTSAIRLAQNMGVDYLFVASLATYGSETKQIKRADLGIDREVTTYRLRTVYKILDIAKGSSLSAGNISSETNIQSGGTLTEKADIANDLIADAAAQIGMEFKKKRVVAKLPVAEKQEGMVEFEVYCSMQDLSVPEVVKGDDGQLMLSANRYKLEPLSVTVELDGVVIGTSPGKLYGYPGLHKIRLTREGFKDWERTINVRQGQILQIALTLDDKGRKNWLEMSKFFAELKEGERLSEAQAEIMKGFATLLKQTGIRIDNRSDIKVDTKDAPTIEKNMIERQNVNE